MKKSLLTVILGTTFLLSGAFAENQLAVVPNEGDNLTRAIVKYEPPEISENKLALVPYDAEFAAKQSCKVKEKAESWGSWALNKTAGVAKYVGGQLVESGAETAKYLLAWNLNYYGVKSLEELTAYGIYAGTSLVAGPAAGNAAYYVTKGAFTVGHWVIPGFDGFIAGTYAPLTKNFVVDPLVNNAPAIANAAVSAASACSGYANSAYNYFWGS